MVKRSIMLIGNLLWLSVPSLFSQQNNTAYSIDRYNINSGLSSNFLRSLCQDEEGYLWIATTNGLNRFDGYSYEIFKPDYGKKNTFNSVNFNSITIAPDGNLWISSDHSGINIFNNKKNIVSIIDRDDTTGLAILDNNINQLYTDSHGRIWICTFNGLNMYDCQSATMTSFPNDGADGERFPYGTMTCAYEDSKGKIIIGTWGNGIYIYKEESKDFTRLLVNENSNLNDSINRVHRLIQDRDGYYWFGTWEAGLFKVEINNYEKIRLIQRYATNSSRNKILTSNIIYSLYEDRNGAIWAGTPYGLNIIENHRNEPEVSIIQEGKNDTELGHNDIFDIFEDKSGIIWLATGGGGLNKIDPNRNPVSIYTIPEIDRFQKTETVRSFYKDDEFGLLIGVNGLGFGRFDASKNTFTRYTDLDAFKNLPENINAATVLFKDSKNNLWIGTRYLGLYMVAAGTKQVSQFLNYDQVTGDRSRQINVLFEDLSHSMWVGTNNGLFRLTSVQDQATYMISRYLPDPDNPEAIIGEYISEIFEDTDTVLWIGTVGGALNYAKNNKGPSATLRFGQFNIDQNNGNSIKSNIVYAVREDMQGRLWIGTGTAGLAMYDKNEKNFKHYLNQPELREASVFDILLSENDLWLTTNNGLIRFREREENDFQTEVFSEEDGLQGNFFIDGAFYKAADGMIYAGGYYGFNILNPSAIKSNPFKPPVTFTRILIANNPVNVYEAMEKGLILNYRKNTIQVEFSALSYSQPEKNKYAYMLGGLDENWQRTGSSNRMVNYSHLPPGNYTLMVNASNNSDIWSDQPVRLKIRVKPHPARSWWAIVIYSLILIGIIAVFYRFQFNNIKIKQAYEIEKLQRREEENLNQFKFRFFTNISHELLTPLSVLSFSVENLIQSKIRDKEPLHIMERNLKRIMQLISQLLDFRKVESGSMSPLVSRGNIDPFISQIVNNLKPFAEKKKISVVLHGDVQEEIYFDPDKLDKIFSNLVSNALKYTPSEGSIIIDYYMEKGNNIDSLFLSVTDSGKGIAPDMFDQVFERFYQVKSVTGKTFGAGIGLALAKSLVEIHKGTIKVENTVSLGAKFTIQIPVSISAYKENEILDEEMNYQAGSMIIDHDDALLPPDENQVEENENSNRHKTILIVEDNSDFRTMIREHLANYYHTIEAENGMKGLEKCLKYQPDLVITDMMMPEMDGIELCNQIKQNIETSDIIVIMLTAKIDEETRYQSYLANADSYIAKPVDVRTLYTRVESLLETRAKLVSKYSNGLDSPQLYENLSAMDRELMESVTSIIEEKLMNTELNVLALSKEIGMSTSNLYRKITRLTGMSPVEFIRFTRLQAAAKMIITDNVNISEAAYASGFNDLSYFSKSFKKQFSLSPKAYQKKHSAW